MMKCFVFRSRHDLSQNVTMRPERIVVLSAFSMFISYLNFQQQAQNVLILTRDTLAANQEWLLDDNGVDELCMLCITGHNNGPVLGASYPKSGQRLIGKNGVWKASYTPDRLSMFSASMFSVGFQVLFSESIVTSNFLSKHAVDMFNEFAYSLGDFGKICLPHPYTTAPLIFLVHWQIFPNFARKGCIRKSSTFDHIFG